VSYAQSLGRGEKHSQDVKDVKALVPDAMSLDLPDISAALAQKVFFTHMERSV